MRLTSSVFSACLFLLGGAVASALHGQGSAGCPADGSFVVHSGKPKGKEVKHEGITIYISEPEKHNPRAKARKDTAVLYLSDVFGLDHVENKLLADSFANAGYVTVVPDLFDGKPAPYDINGFVPGFDIPEFLARHEPFATDPIIAKTASYIRTKLKIPRIAATGYCFGGRYAFRVLSTPTFNGTKIADVAYAAHPSLLGDDEILAIEGPVSVAAAEYDELLLPERRHEIEALLLQTGQSYQTVVYSGTVHGFAVRANVSVEEEKYGKEEAFLQAVRWFDRFVVGRK